MRGIIWKLSRFESKDVVKSTWPKKILGMQEFNKDTKTLKLKNVVGVWVTIEKDDQEEYVEQFARRIQDLNNKFYRLQEVVVLPFVHLSHNLEEPERAKSLLESLVEKVKAIGLKVQRISFGTHKRMLFEIPGQVAEASYFEFPYTGEKPTV